MLRSTPIPFLKWLAVGCCVSTAVTAQSSVTCPANDGYVVVKLVMTSPRSRKRLLGTLLTARRHRGTKQYELQCGKTVRVAPLRDFPCSDALVCAEECAKDAACVHSTYNSDDNECYLKPNGPPGNPRSEQWTWHYVGPAPPASQNQGAQNPPSGNPPAQQPLGGNTGAAPAPGPGSGSGAMAANCPADDGKDYTTPNGVTYQLKCDHDLAQAVALSSLAVASLQQCANTCAQDPQCVAMDFIASNNQCYLKATSGPLRSTVGVHSWIPQTCPSPRPMVANTNPAIININTDLICPQNDGKIFEAADGTWYYLQCCTDTSGAVAIDAVAATSHADCIDKCTADPKCKSATYATWGQTNCKLYGHNQFSTTHIGQIHHAFVTDPRRRLPSRPMPRCARQDAPMPTASSSLAQLARYNFQMTCDKRHGTTVLRKERHKTFSACMAACAAMPACHSVDYEARTLNCYLTNNVHQPGIAATAFASAHSLGCAGACASCKGGCDDLVSGGAGQAIAADCPADDGKIVTSHAEDFRIMCGVCAHSPKSTLGHTAAGAPATTLAECAEACAMEPTCASANLLIGAVSNAIECWMHKAMHDDGVTPSELKKNPCNVVVKQSGGMVSYPITP
ncbi:hypothetical protein PG993_007327 [Apiospora rasikravindrae]|uniref:Apple domain-containing protein n=1 Tax=Apiospora rasikravindrae TaxID=990691 RepID=A0ABR1SYK7_9PEZI